MLTFVAVLLQACSSSSIADDETTTGRGNENLDTLAINDGYTYELPVIFHVLYTNDL